MVNPAYIKKAIIDLLQANTALVTALGGNVNQIAESQLQLQDFTYPAVRVDAQVQTPIGTGTDRIRLSYANLTVRVFSTDPSSMEADNILGLVVEALFDKSLNGATDLTNVPNFNLKRINLVNSDPAYRLSERVWMRTAMFESLVNLLNPG